MKVAGSLARIVFGIVPSLVALACMARFWSKQLAELLQASPRASQ